MEPLEVQDYQGPMKDQDDVIVAQIAHGPGHHVAHGTDGVGETSGGKLVAARAEEAILIGADFKARALPAIDDWIKRRGG